MPISPISGSGRAGSGASPLRPSFLLAAAYHSSGVGMAGARSTRKVVGSLRELIVCVVRAFAAREYDGIDSQVGQIMAKLCYSNGPHLRERRKSVAYHQDTESAIQIRSSHSSRRLHARRLTDYRDCAGLETGERSIRKIFTR